MVERDAYIRERAQRRLVPNAPVFTAGAEAAPDPSAAVSERPHGAHARPAGTGATRESETHP